MRKVPSSLKPGDVERWFNDRRAHITPTRASQSYRVLRVIFSMADRDGRLPLGNPCNIKGAGSVEAPERPYLSEAEAHKLMAALVTSFYVPVLITAYAALRKSELLGLQRGDFNEGRLRVARQAQTMPGGTVVLRLTKTGRVRTVSLPKAVADILSAHIDCLPEGGPDQPMFLHRGSAMTLAQLQGE